MTKIRDLSKPNTYVFSVPATYVYEIDANTEEEARQILRERGGRTVIGDLLEITDKDYRNAQVEEVWKEVKSLKE